MLDNSRHLYSNAPERTRRRVISSGLTQADQALDKEGHTITRIHLGFHLILRALVLASLMLVFPGSAVLAKEKKVDINTATEAELATVPGISKELAALIVEYRETEGAIESWEVVATLQKEAELRKLEKHLKVGSGDN